MFPRARGSLGASGHGTSRSSNFVTLRRGQWTYWVEWDGDATNIYKVSQEEANALTPRAVSEHTTLIMNASPSVVVDRKDSSLSNVPTRRAVSRHGALIDNAVPSARLDTKARMRDETTFEAKLDRCDLFFSCNKPQSCSHKEQYPNNTASSDAVVGSTQMADDTTEEAVFDRYRHIRSSWHKGDYSKSRIRARRSTPEDRIYGYSVCKHSNARQCCDSTHVTLIQAGSAGDRIEVLSTFSKLNSYLLFYRKTSNS